VYRSVKEAQHMMQSGPEAFEIAGADCQCLEDSFLIAPKPTSKVR
jgi:hypothetical protein